MAACSLGQCFRLGNICSHVRPTSWPSCFPASLLLCFARAFPVQPASTFHRAGALRFRSPRPDAPRALDSRNARIPQRAAPRTRISSPQSSRDCANRTTSTTLATPPNSPASTPNLATRDASASRASCAPAAYPTATSTPRSTPSSPKPTKPPRPRAPEAPPRSPRGPLDQRKIASLYGSLLRAGFSSDVIRAELKRAAKGDVAELPDSMGE